MPSPFLSRVGAWTSIAALALVIVGAPIHELVHAKWPGAGLSGKFGFEAIRSGRAAKELETTLEKRAALTERIRPSYNEAMFLTLGAVTPRVTLGKDDWLFLSSNAKEYPSEVGLRNLDLTCQTLARLLRWFEDNGTVVELLVIPRKPTVHPEMLPDAARARFKPAYPRILESLAKAGRPCIDLLEPFQASKERVYLPNDDHWDHPGALIAVREVAARLRQRFEGRDLPGTPVSRTLVTRPTFRFAGGVVKMLGFTPDGALFERFKVDRSQIVAVDPAEPARSQLGVQRPEEIVVVGTSFSAGFYTASLLSAELGREVENRAREGHAGGFRIMDLARELLLGQREFPKVLVWEFPEDFLLTQVRALIEPANAILDAAKAPQPLTSSPLAIAARREVGVRVTAQRDTLIEGVSPDGSSELVFDLAESLPGDGSVRLSYELLITGNGLHRVLFDSGPGSKATTPKEFLLLRNDLPNRILLPVVGVDAAPVTRIRLRILSAMTDFKLSPLEAWRGAGLELEGAR